MSNFVHIKPTEYSEIVIYVDRFYGSIVKILAISYSYPSNKNPHHGIFVKNLMEEMAGKGHEVTVITPRSILNSDSKSTFHQEDDVSVYSPKFLSFGAVRWLGIRSYFLTQFFFNKAVMRIVKRKKIKADVVYSHFLLSSGVAALKAGKFLDSPVFCTLGESSLDIHENKFSLKKLRKLYAEFDGLFFNSSHTKDFAVERYEVLEEKCLVVPNGVDKSIFFKRNKDEARKKLGLPLNDKILIFVGSLIERKGPLRVLEACNQLKNPLKLIFIGTGSQLPEGENVIFANPVEHSLLPWYLSASDVFVLPTLREGMPNAVLEAIACGIPVVTSPIPPNTSVLGSDYTLFCDPSDTRSIADAIGRALDSNVVQTNCVSSISERATIILNRMFKV